MNIITRLKAQAGKLKANITEVYTMVLITIGLPAIAYIYIDWKAAVTVCILAQLVIGILAIRSSN